MRDLRKSIQTGSIQELLLFADNILFQRTWFIQEVAMADRDSPVLYGDQCPPRVNVHDAAISITKDHQRFGCEIIGSNRPRILRSWAYELARDLVLGERPRAGERTRSLLRELMLVQHN